VIDYCFFPAARLTTGGNPNERLKKEAESPHRRRKIEFHGVVFLRTGTIDFSPKLFY
jgi:hypothetical protein